LEDLSDRARHRRGDRRDEDVAVLDVPELVRKHALDLDRRQAVQQTLRDRDGRMLGSRPVAKTSAPPSRSFHRGTISSAVCAAKASRYSRKTAQTFAVSTGASVAARSTEDSAASAVTRRSVM
jgi:hypothetical protein